MRNLYVFALMCLFVLALAPSGGMVNAAPTGTTIKVSTTLDEVAMNSKCSLREAILSSNDNKAVGGCPPGTGSDKIIVPAGIYKLTLKGNMVNDPKTGDLNVRGAVTIKGAGIGETVIDGNKIDRVFHLATTSINNPSQITLSDMTIRNGLARDGFGGGGISNTGAQVTLRRVHVMKNKTIQGTGGNSGGGGIINKGFMRLYDVLLTKNSAPQPTSGIANQGAAAVNFACTPNCGMEMERVTISDNAPGSGALSNNSTLAAVNVTISGNGGDGIENHSQVSSLVMKNGTIANNGGYGLTEQWNATLANVILDNNTLGNCEDLGEQGIVSLGGNVSDDSSCANHFNASGDQNDSSPQLGILQLNGGLTPTHALAPSSPGIDVGNEVQCPAFDQRGIARPQDGNGDTTSTCDSGATEFVGTDFTNNPTLQSPADEAILNKLRVLLDWSDSTFGAYYQVELRRTSIDGVVIMNVTPLESQIKTGTLQRGFDYLWRVRACNDLGCSDWTPFRKFTVAQ